VPAELRRVLKPGSKIAIFCFTPSLEDPLARAVHDEMVNGPDFEHYKTRPTHVLNERDKTLLQAQLLLKPGHAFKTMAVEVTRPVETPLDQLMTYLDTTNTVGQELRDHPDRKARLMQKARQDAPEKRASLRWDCDVYMGEALP